MQDLVGKKVVSGNKSKSVEEIVESVVKTVSEWVCRREEFTGVSLEDSIDIGLLFKRGGRMQKSGIIVIGFVLPLEYLKLNFDGSFLHFVKRGDFGGVIRDWHRNG